MEFTCKIDAMKQALKRIQFFVGEPQNPFPYGNLSAGEGQVIVAGSNGVAAYIETAIPAEVTGEGSCQVGELFEKVLTNIPGDDITCKVNAASISMMNAGGLKARAQIPAGEFPPRLVLREKLDALQFVHDITLFKSELMSLIRVSESLPPTPGKLVQWLFLKIENGVFVGSTQESEMGAIEVMPFNLVGFQSNGGDIVFRANTNYFKTLASLCDNQVQLRMTADPRNPILINDPLDEGWWASLIGIG